MLIYGICFTLFQTDWVQALEANSHTPQKLALRLEHEYTEHNLSFDGLKGKDRHYVDLLKNAVTKDGDKMICHLVLATKTKSG